VRKTLEVLTLSHKLSFYTLIITFHSTALGVCAANLNNDLIHYFTDTILLAEIMTSFRKSTMEMFELDIGHYISLPQYAYDVMLKMTNVEIEHMTDYSMILFFEKSLRGGSSYINQRHSSAGQNQMGKFVEMLYLDANNLYGW
jgi:hypothetical protein